MGFDGWRMYCVEWNVLKASPFKKSLGCSSPATGRICQPVSLFRIWDKSSSWGTCMQRVLSGIPLQAFRKLQSHTHQYLDYGDLWGKLATVKENTLITLSLEGLPHTR